MCVSVILSVAGTVFTMTPVCRGRLPLLLTPSTHLLLMLLLLLLLVGGNTRAQHLHHSHHHHHQKYHQHQYLSQVGVSVSTCERVCEWTVLVCITWTHYHYYHHHYHYHHKHLRQLSVRVSRCNGGT